MSNRFSLGGRNVHAFRAALSLVVALLLCTTTIGPAFAAGGEVGNISGTIIDAQTKAPVANAQIALAAPSGSFSAKTNSAGFFTILGVTVDTYVLSVSASGFDALTIPGITVQGDQTLSLGNLQINKHLQTIGRVTARSTNGAFQPTQTTDSYTVSGARIIQTVGKTATTNENNLLLAVPGVTLSNAGIPSIRGGGAREVGYQYDGVTFTEPFLSNNGSNGLINGVGNVQVVEGAGDATQGGVGSGVINIVPKRGAYPGFGYRRPGSGRPELQPPGRDGVRFCDAERPLLRLHHLQRPAVRAVLWQFDDERRRVQQLLRQLVSVERPVHQQLRVQVRQEQQPVAADSLHEHLAAGLGQRRAASRPARSRAIPTRSRTIPSTPSARRRGSVSAKTSE